MKAIVKQHPEKGLALVNKEIPKISPTEVLIKVKKSAICGTDVHIYQWGEWAKKNITCPTTIGHEFSGEIVERGSAVTSVNIGERVSAEGHIFCEKCELCLNDYAHLCLKTIGIGIHRDGGFAEYVSVPAKNVVTLPDFIDNNCGAILDPFGNATHAAMEVPLKNKDVLITGAGPIGIYSAIIAEHCHASSICITDQSDYRLDILKQSTIDCINIKKKTIADHLQKKRINSFDICLEMSGNPLALEQCIDNLKPGGNLILLGIFSSNISTNWNKIIFKGIKIHAISGRKIFKTWEQMFELIKSNIPIKNVTTHSLPYTDFDKGFNLLLNGQAGKIILDWDI
jgi:threonine 3-dehydrogenase